MIVCFSTPYAQSKNCKKELEYADELGKELILVKVDPDASWSRCFQYDFSEITLRKLPKITFTSGSADFQKRSHFQ